MTLLDVWRRVSLWNRHSWRKGKRTSVSHIFFQPGTDSVDAVSSSRCQAEVYTYEFCDEDHPAQLLDALRHFYLSGLFTDVSLRCGESGQVFHCHKALLSARSSYFKVMFTADMKERSNRLITLAGVDGGILAALVNYVYTAQVSITEGNVQSLLEAADLLQFLSVKRACVQFLIRRLDVYNCLGMHAFALLHTCPDLEREARRLMLSRFSELVQQEEFLELDVDTMRSVLSAQNLSGPRDDVLIDAAVKWVTHDLDGRVHHSAELLRSIHLDLDEMYFKASLDVHGPHLHKNDGTFKSMITQASRPNMEQKSTTGGKVSSSVYVIGGYYWHPLCEVHIWNPVSDTWLRGKDMPDHARESYSITLLGANIYVTGGYRTNTVEALDTVFIYNCDHDDWTEGRPMVMARYYHCTVALRGCVYALGGYRGGAPERDTEFYDPLKKKWFPVANMIQGMMSVGAGEGSGGRVGRP